MTSFTLAAPAKLNLFLEILGKRADGFHEVLTVMDSVAYGDEVVIAPSDQLVVTADRDDVPDGEANLAHRIVRLAEEQLGRALPAEITIKKRLPPGTGVGAGSSDAATALAGVLKLHDVQLEARAQRELAGQVGSDVAFFVDGGLAMCLGRGEHVQSLDGLARRHYVLILGGPPMPTAEVYQALELAPASAEVAPLVHALATGEPLTRELLHNRLEEAAYRVAPELKALRKAIQQATHEPLLSGSGSTHFLLADSAAHAEELVGRLSKVKDITAIATHSTTGQSADDTEAASAS